MQTNKKKNPVICLNKAICDKKKKLSPQNTIDNILFCSFTSGHGALPLHVICIPVILPWRKLSFVFCMQLTSGDILLVKYASLCIVLLSVLGPSWAGLYAGPLLLVPICEFVCVSDVVTRRHCLLDV